MACSTTSGTWSPSRTVAWASLSTSRPDLKPNNPMNSIGTVSASTEKANHPPSRIRSWVKLSLLIATAIRGGSAVTWKTALAIWPLARPPARAVTKYIPYDIVHSALASMAIAHLRRRAEPFSRLPSPARDCAPSAAIAPPERQWSVVQGDKQRGRGANDKTSMSRSSAPQPPTPLPTYPPRRRGHPDSRKGR